MRFGKFSKRLGAIESAAEGKMVIEPDNELHYPHLRSLIPPRRLWVGPEDSIAHFWRWPFEFRAYMQLLCGLTNESDVLELGCNHGRTALALVDLIEKGSYKGFDILPEHIDFANSAFSQVNPRFSFVYADVYNATYNPRGKQSASSFAFPFGTSSFDIVYAASLFTHLTHDAVSNYLGETSRVLKRGGSALFSFFFLDHYQGPGSSACDLYEFDNPVQGSHSNDCRTHNPQEPEAVIAYSISYISNLAEKEGLSVERVVPGYWSSKSQSGVNEQDFIILRKH